jgi:hypothetical protein
MDFQFKSQRVFQEKHGVGILEISSSELADNYNEKWCSKRLPEENTHIAKKGQSYFCIVYLDLLHILFPYLHKLKILQS